MTLSRLLLLSFLVPPGVESDERVAPEPAKELWAEVPVADGFDFPVGLPDARDWRFGRVWREADHLGVDWNFGGPCNADLGLPVHSVGHGTVRLAEDIEGGWGNVVQVVHRLEDGTLFQTQYAHLDQIDVAVGEQVARGKQVGTVGNAHGVYCAHLHFEVRADPNYGIGGGYGEPADVYVDPIGFLKARRPSPPVDLK